MLLIVFKVAQKVASTLSVLKEMGDSRLFNFPVAISTPTSGGSGQSNLLSVGAGDDSLIPGRPTNVLFTCHALILIKG